jgi:uncharacterized protein (DUF2147 family)
MDDENMRMKFSKLCAVTAVAASALTSTLIGMETAHADPMGVWLAEDGGRIRVNSCGGTVLCGTIVTPKAWGPTTDSNNPDPALRGRPLIGVAVLISMRPDGPAKWSGQLYNTDNGQTYDGHLREINGQTIRVEGCVIGICGGRNLTRVQ